MAFTVQGSILVKIIPLLIKKKTKTTKKIISILSLSIFLELRIC